MFAGALEQGFGHAHVIAVDVNERRLELARTMGAHDAVRPDERLMLTGDRPIVGGAVNPYIDRRQRLREDPSFVVPYEHPSLEPVLKETLGTIIFQDQVIEVAMAFAGFSPGDRVAVRHRDELESELEKAVLQARDEQAKSAAIIAAIADGISIQGLDFRVQYQNEVHQRLMGGDRRGALCYEAYSNETDICPACPLADAFADGQVHRLEKPASPAAGSSPSAAITVRPHCPSTASRTGSRSVTTTKEGGRSFSRPASRHMRHSRCSSRRMLRSDME